MVKCRVCGKEIEYDYWKAHVRKHKLDFCKETNNIRIDYWKIDWEDVVHWFNPSESKYTKRREKKQLNELEIRDGSMQLSEFNKENKK